MRYNQQQLAALDEDNFQKYVNSYIAWYRKLTPEQRQAENQYAAMIKQARDWRAVMHAQEDIFSEPSQPAQAQYTPPQYSRANAEPQPYAYRPAQQAEQVSPSDAIVVPVKSACLLVSALMGIAYGLYILLYFFTALSSQDSSAAAVGTGIAAALVAPHMLCAIFAAIFNTLGWALRKRGFALTGAILYTVAAVLFPIYALFVIVQAILSYVGFARLKKLKGKTKEHSILQAILTAVAFVLAIVIGISGGVSAGKNNDETASVTNDSASAPYSTAQSVATQTEETESASQQEQISLVMADDLIREYETNGVAADEKYKGKTIMVYGTIKNIDKDILDRPYVTFQGDDPYSFNSVQCYFEEADVGSVSALQPGEEITIAGICEDSTINITLKKCIIVG